MGKYVIYNAKDPDQLLRVNLDIENSNLEIENSAGQSLVLGRDPSYKNYIFHDDLDGTFSGAEVSDKLFIAAGTLNNTYIPSISSGIKAYGQYGVITSTTNQAARFQSHAINSPGTKPSGYVLPIVRMKWKCRMWLPDDSLGNFPKWFGGLFGDNNVSIGAYFYGGGTTTRALSCTTNGTTTLASSALFTYADIGRTVTGTGIPADTKIVRFVSTSSVIMSNAATDSTTGNRNFADAGTWHFCTYNATDGLQYVDTGVANTVGAYYKLEFISDDNDGTILTPYINGTAYSPLTLRANDYALGLVNMAGVKNSTSGNQAFGLDYITFTFPDNR